MLILRCARSTIPRGDAALAGGGVGEKEEKGVYDGLVGILRETGVETCDSLPLVDLAGCIEETGVLGAIARLPLLLGLETRNDDVQRVNDDIGDG